MVSRITSFIWKCGQIAAALIEMQTVTFHFFWSDLGASEKNHNRLRLVSGSEYRMAVDEDRALLASELLQLTRERRGVMGVQWRMLDLWSVKCRLFQKFPMSSQNLRNSPLFYRAGLPVPRPANIPGPTKLAALSSNPHSRANQAMSNAVDQVLNLNMRPLFSIALPAPWIRATCLHNGN